MLAGVLALSWAAPASAQAPLRKIAELRLSILGISAGVEPAHPAVPKNTPAGVRIVVRSGERELSLAETAAVFGAGFEIQGDLSGPGLSKTLALPYTPAPLDDPNDPDDTLPVPAGPLDPLILPLPGLPVSGDYRLANLRITAPGRPDFDVTPRQVTLQVIEQVLVTSVKTRQLTLDEIKEKGIVLGADDYVAFEFALGLKLESEVVDMTFPVVFNREGVALPQTISPPPAPARRASDLPLPTIVPVLFQVDDGAGVGPAPKLPPLPSGQGPIKIPSVIVIPGNIGYLKSFFSAQLFVANGTPAGSGLVVDEVTGTIHLPPGPDLDPEATEDNPLALPTSDARREADRPAVDDAGPRGGPRRRAGHRRRRRGAPARRAGAGRVPPAWRVRGLPHHRLRHPGPARAASSPGRCASRAGPRGASSSATPSSTWPSPCPVWCGPGSSSRSSPRCPTSARETAQDVFLDPSELSTSGAQFVGHPPPAIPEIRPGESATLELEFLALVTGQVTASYLRFEAAATPPAASSSRWGSARGASRSRPTPWSCPRRWTSSRRRS